MSAPPPSSSRARAIEAKRKPARSRAITACERLFLGYESRDSYERASYRKPAIRAVDALLAAVHEAEGKTQQTLLPSATPGSLHMAVEFNGGPDFEKVAGDWLYANGLAEKRSVWAHEKGREALSELLRSVHAQGREVEATKLAREIGGYLDRLQAAHQMLADCAAHIDMLCMCGHEAAGGETITPDQCWWHRIQSAMRGEYVPHRETP